MRILINAKLLKIYGTKETQVSSIFNNNNSQCSLVDIQLQQITNSFSSIEFTQISVCWTQVKASQAFIFIET